MKPWLIAHAALLLAALACGNPPTPTATSTLLPLYPTSPIVTRTNPPTSTRVLPTTAVPTRTRAPTGTQVPSPTAQSPTRTLTPLPVTAAPTQPPPPTIAPTQPPPTDLPPQNCDASYPTVCIPPPPPDLDCGDVPYSNFTVLPPDPHGFDGDSDGVGCEG